MKKIQIHRQQSEGRGSACILCSPENGTPIFQELKQANTSRWLHFSF